MQASSPATASADSVKLPGSGTAVKPPAEEPALWPKCDSTIVKSLMSTVPVPVNSPWASVPLWPKCDRTIVRSLILTRPSRLASPANPGRQEEASVRVVPGAARPHEDLPGVVHAFAKVERHAGRCVAGREIDLPAADFRHRAARGAIAVIIEAGAGVADHQTAIVDESRLPPQ